MLGKNQKLEQQDNLKGKAMHQVKHAAANRSARVLWIILLIKVFVQIPARLFALLK